MYSVVASMFSSRSKAGELGVAPDVAASGALLPGKRVDVSRQRCAWSAMARATRLINSTSGAEMITWGESVVGVPIGTFTSKTRSRWTYFRGVFWVQTVRRNQNQGCKP